MNSILNPVFGSSGTQEFYTTKIPYSCRFDSLRTTSLSRTPSVAGSRRKMTFSAWVKRSAISANQYIFSAGVGSTDNTMFTIVFGNADTLQVTGFSGIYFNSYAVFRDVSQWMHMHVMIDTTNAVAADRVQVWFNGVRLANSSSTNPTLNQDMSFNTTAVHTIGKQSWGTALHYNGYLSDVHYIDGSVLAASTFGQFSTQNPNVWIPKTPSGITYGTNGFHLTFSDAAAHGTDTSGNGNNWSSSGLTSGDQMTDTPTNNYCTWNPISKYGTIGTLSNGNLVSTGASNYYEVGTFQPKSGKWYFEFNLTSGSGTGAWIGFGNQNNITDLNDARYYRQDGQYWNGSSISVYGASYTINDIVGCAVDIDGQTVEFFKNGISQGQKTSIGSINACPLIGIAGYTATVNFGATPFMYTPPTDFKALCSKNLPDPTIIDSTKYFDAKLYTGTGVAQNITSFNFQPDLVWIKNRTTALNNKLIDSVRGVTKSIESNTTAAETTESTGLTAFLTNGFTIGDDADYNTSTNNFISWCWKKGSVPGFDIVTYTGNGTNRTITHSLGATPELMILKSRSVGGSPSYGWPVWHKYFTGTQFIVLNDTAALNTSGATVWNSTVPTSTVFSIGTDNGVNQNAVTYIAYLFRSVPGFSKIDTFVSNASADGTFIYCGFRPCFVMYKNVNAAGDWGILDNKRPTYNGATKGLSANQNIAEYTSDNFDFLSNGFKLRGTGTAAGTYAFIAFAEAPFKYTNAR